MSDLLQLNQNEKELLEHSVQEMENELDTDREAALADMRYTFELKASVPKRWSSMGRAGNISAANGLIIS